MPMFLRMFLLKVRYSRWFATAVSILLLLFGICVFPLSRRLSAKLLMLSHRNSFTDASQIRRETWLKRFGLFDIEIIRSLVPPHEPIDDSIYRRRVIKLKEPNGNEKGVILLKFLDTYSWLCRTHDMPRVLQDYYIALEMSYYGACRPEVLQFLAFKEFPIAVGGAVPQEWAFLARLNSNLIPSAYSACTWIDDRTFFPVPATKEYDCILVATWNPVKRYNLLFEALTKIDQPYRALIIGGAYGGTRDEIEAQIDYYGVRDKVVVMEDVDQKDINVFFGKSRVNLMLSLKEAGNKAIIEGMFSDTPAIILSDHIGLDHSWINDQTGKIADPANLAETLLWFKTTKQQFTPRAWAMEHISCRVSTKQLEQTLRTIAKQKNEPWTRSIVAKYNRGATPMYYNEQEALTPFEFDRYRYPQSKPQAANV